MENEIGNRTATIAMTQQRTIRYGDETGIAEGSDINEEYVDMCAEAVDSAIMAVSTATHTLRNELMNYGNKAKKAILNELQGIIDREVWEPQHYTQV